jgi:hypothetical protein
MGTPRFAHSRILAHQTWPLYGCLWVYSIVIDLPQTEVLASFIAGGIRHPQTQMIFAELTSNLS